jgi:enoyl-CoA hydratase/carnithine racemase
MALSYPGVPRLFHHAAARQTEILPKRRMMGYTTAVVACAGWAMPVLYEKRNHVGYLTLSRPEARNCWGEDFNDEITRLCAEMEADDDIRVAVLTGDPEGNAFSAGANIKDPNTHMQATVGGSLKDFPRRHKFAGQVLGEFPKPVIAAVNGYAIGIGCIVTCCCDLIIASDRADWRLPQVGLGILPNHGGIPRLARWIGQGSALKIGFGYPLKAAEAHAAGLAQWLFPHDRLMDETSAIAEHIAAMPPLAARLAKESLRRGLDATIEDASYMDLYRAMLLSMTDDAKESHAAWRERRKPEIKGT